MDAQSTLAALIVACRSVADSRLRLSGDFRADPWQRLAGTGIRTHPDRFDPKVGKQGMAGNRIQTIRLSRRDQLLAIHSARANSSTVRGSRWSTRADQVRSLPVPVVRK